MLISSGKDTHKAAGPRHISIAIITISDTRTPDTDSSGTYLSTALQQAGHNLHSRHLIKDDKQHIQQTLELLLNERVPVIITSGGTGIAGRDVTIPVVEALIQKPMPGFGELFRMLSFEDIGSAAMLSRATAGVADNSIVFALPGSSNAVKTAWDKLIAPEISHLVFELQRHA